MKQLSLQVELFVSSSWTSRLSDIDAMSVDMDLENDWSPFLKLLIYLERQYQHKLEKCALN